MSESRLEYLFDLYINNNYSSQEEEELMALLEQNENKEIVKRLIGRLIENTGSEIHLDMNTAESIFKNILQYDIVDRDKESMGNVIPLKRGKSIIQFWFRVAAVLILFLGGVSVYILLNHTSGRKSVTIADKPTKILPGGNRAILTISDGTSVLLDSMQNGASFTRGKTVVTKKGSMLIYSISPSGQNNSVVYSTLSTPRGGQYQVLLPDGSKVWLNAASSIYFPSQFSSEKREVHITGEAYFEVAKNKNKPFIVEVGQIAVRVLGTHFDINAYPDEEVIKTSLLEGSVKIIQDNSTSLLNPGQQAVWNEREEKVSINNADMDEVVAWKNGLFQFDGASIVTIMREIGRWYNVQIEYEGKIPSRKFEGKISRSAQLSEVLKILELSNIKFTLVGNKIIVH